MGAERIVLMTVHFSRWWNTPTVTSDSVLDVRTAEQRHAEQPHACSTFITKVSAVQGPKYRFLVGGTCNIV